ncbi:5-hydroxytryptamine receptor 3A-like [Plectropomus leopardus]|uniref:5-hydroxytryptamine receptor 3A-like n=1 Tax=Plectropomus leopardus TaxID=160734 RepID=UPI001C4C73EE|nr:5-hydroxytryptamine receptor 3A-like [Plectropomus leopardus]
MILTGFLFLLFFTGGSTSNYSANTELIDHQQKSNQSIEGEGSTSSYPNPHDNDHTRKDVMKPDPPDKCSYQDVLKHLNLSKNKDLYIMVRPVKHYKETTRVHLQMSMYGILDVREKDQAFVPYIWIYMGWQNQHIWWNPPDFCGLEKIVVPTEALWKPDLTIEEMTEKDKAPPVPFLTVRWSGKIEFRNDQMLVSTCKMQVYKFPFDIQSCSLSFKSVVYSDKEVKFEAILDSSKITRWSNDLMRTQYEWLFISMTVKETTVNNFSYNQSMIIYTIKMRRRSVLYIANFLVPVLFFFCLDLASFLISDSGGEKLGFKITVLLAVTVMQLILNEILPSSSDRVPLIAVYCIGMFGLMLLSLLETILVMHLVEKDSASQGDEAVKDQSLSEDCGDKDDKDNMHSYDGKVKKWTDCACVCDVSTDEPPSELLSVAKEGSSSHLTEESHALEKVSDELREMIKTLVPLLDSRKEEKPGYWTKVTKIINKCFFIFYATAASLFLIVIFSVWSTAADE